MGSIGLLYATQTRAPHRSHSQLNDGVDGIGTWSTRGQVSTSRNSKSGMHQRYTRNLFDLALNPHAYHHTATAIPSNRTSRWKHSRASVTRLTQDLNEKRKHASRGAEQWGTHMWAILIGLVVIGVLMSVTTLSTRTVAVTHTKTEVQNATVHVAAPPGMKPFPATLIPLP
jgi:hypothetical protein